MITVNSSLQLVQSAKKEVLLLREVVLFLFNGT